MLRTRIGMTVSAVLLLSSVGLSGCGTNNNNEGAAGNNNVQTKNVRGVNDGRLSVNSVRGGGHNIGDLNLDAALSRKVAAIPGVRNANVIVAGRSAYVAVGLDRNATGQEAANRITTQGKNMTPGSTGYGTGNGTGYGTGGGTLYRTNGTGMGMNGTLTQDGKSLTGHAGNGAAGGMHPAGTAGSRMDAAGTGADADGLTDAMKDKIANEVKQSATIDRVYVSANPDFVQRVSGYADQFRAGHPIQGFVNEFSTMVERIFPAASGTKGYR